MPLSIAARRSATILVVDDQNANRYAVARMLALAGFHVIEAATGVDALRIAEDQPDLIVLDVGLSDVDGFEVCRRIKANPATSAIPIVHVSADFTSTEARAHGLAGGADGYLSRPFEEIELVALVNALLRMRDAERQRVRERTEEVESRYRALFNHTPMPMWVVERRTLEILAVNDAAVAQYGYSPDEFLTMRAPDLQAPSYVERFLDNVAASMSMPTVNRVALHRRKDGSEIEVEIVAHAFSFEGRAARLVIGKDVTAQRQGDAALRRSEAQLRAQFMAIPVPTYAWVADGDDFRLTSFNQAALDITHGEIQSLVGRRASEMFGADYADYADYARSMRECLRTDRPIRLDASHRLVTTGEIKDLLVHFAPVQPDHVLVHTVDETERRAAERTSRASEERFRALTENAMDLVSVLDADGTFQYLSPSYELVLGIAPATLIGTSPFALIHPDDVAPSHAVLSRIIEQPGALLRSRVRIRHHDGSYRVIDISGRNLLDHSAIRGIVCNGRDITKQEAAESELRFRAHLLDTVEQAVIATTLDGTITYWNRFAEHLYGWSAAETLGRPVFEVARTVRSDEQAHEHMERLARGESWVGEIEVHSRDGRRFPVHAINSPIRAANGELIGVVGVTKDISDRRALEDQLRQAQRLEALGTLAGGVAHDFNNLLTVIRANAEFLRAEVTPTPSVASDLAEVIAAVDRASALTRQLLAFSRKQMLKPEPLDVNAVVNDMQRLLERLIGEDITLETRLDPDLGTIFADRGQVEQVVMNLAVNARDAMRRGGTLSITTANVLLDENVRIRDAEVVGGPYVCLAVSDTGEGMDRRTIEHIFEPFFTTKGVGRGTGLGLSTVYGIVRQSGGYVSVYSEPGEGSVFKVYLPRQDGASDHAAASSLRSERGTERVLLVEDEDAVRAVARRILENLGYAVVEARNGREAIERFGAHGSDFDLVVTDTVMPEIGGHELVARLRRTRPGMRVLYMSGYTEDEIVRRGLEPATRFLQKPFTAEDLGAAVRQTLDGAAPG